MIIRNKIEKYFTEWSTEYRPLFQVFIKHVWSKYNQEFKDSAVKLCIDSDKLITAIARDLGLNKGTLILWVSKYKDSNNLIFSIKISKEF